MANIADFDQIIYGYRIICVQNHYAKEQVDLGQYYLLKHLCPIFRVIIVFQNSDLQVDKKLFFSVKKYKYFFSFLHKKHMLRSVFLFSNQKVLIYFIPPQKQMLLVPIRNA